MIKVAVLTILFLSFLSCKIATKKETVPVQTVINFQEPDTVLVDKYSVLASFLKQPFYLRAYKAKMDMFTTTFTRNPEYAFNPKLNDSIYYSYNFPTKKTGPKKVNEIIVFKYGANKHRYVDESEILIEMRIFNPDPDLEKWNLIGLSQKELESKFGTKYLHFKGGIVFYHENRVLILELKKSLVTSYRYIKLNKKRIDLDFIEQITS